MPIELGSHTVILPVLLQYSRKQFSETEQLLNVYAQHLVGCPGDIASSG